MFQSNSSLQQVEEKLLNPFGTPAEISQIPKAVNDAIPLSLPASDLFHEVTAGDGVKKHLDVYDNGYYTSLCWVEITTITVPKNGSSTALREYAIMIQTPSDIPDKHFDPQRADAEVVPYEIVDHDTRKSQVVNFTTISKSPEATVRQHRRLLCGSGPIYSKELTEWPGSNKKRIEIKVSPKKSLLVAKRVDNKKQLPEEESVPDQVQVENSNQKTITESGNYTVSNKTVQETTNDKLVTSDTATSSNKTLLNSTKLKSESSKMDAGNLDEKPEDEEGEISGLNTKDVNKPLQNTTLEPEVNITTHSLSEVKDDDPEVTTSQPLPKPKESSKFYTTLRDYAFSPNAELAKEINNLWATSTSSQRVQIEQAIKDILIESGVPEDIADEITGTAVNATNAQLTDVAVSDNEQVENKRVPKSVDVKGDKTTIKKEDRNNSNTVVDHALLKNEEKLQIAGEKNATMDVSTNKTMPIKNEAINDTVTYLALNETISPNSTKDSNETSELSKEEEPFDLIAIDSALPTSGPVETTSESDEGDKESLSVRGSENVPVFFDDLQSSEMKSGGGLVDADFATFSGPEFSDKDDSFFDWDEDEYEEDPYELLIPDHVPRASSRPSVFDHVPKGLSEEDDLSALPSSDRSSMVQGKSIFMKVLEEMLGPDKSSQNFRRQVPKRQDDLRTAPDRSKSNVKLSTIPNSAAKVENNSACNKRNKQKLRVRVKVLVESILDFDNGNRVEHIVSPVFGIEKKADYDLVPGETIVKPVADEVLNAGWDKFLNDISNNYFLLNKDTAKSFKTLPQKYLNVLAPDADFGDKVPTSEDRQKQIKHIQNTLSACTPKTVSKPGGFMNNGQNGNILWTKPAPNSEYLPIFNSLMYKPQPVAKIGQGAQKSPSVSSISASEGIGDNVPGMSEHKMLEEILQTEYSENQPKKSTMHEFKSYSSVVPSNDGNGRNRSVLVTDFTRKHSSEEYKVEEMLDRKPGLKGSSSAPKKVRKYKKVIIMKYPNGEEVQEEIEENIDDEDTAEQKRAVDSPKKQGFTKIERGNGAETLPKKIIKAKDDVVASKTSAKDKITAVDDNAVDASSNKVKQAPRTYADEDTGFLTNLLDKLHNILKRISPK